MPYAAITKLLLFEDFEKSTQKIPNEAGKPLFRMAQMVTFTVNILCAAGVACAVSV